MKFNWGTGIVIFLGLFLTAAAVFIVFAFRQNIDLVETDYYEKGVDYSNQMDVNARSVNFQDFVQTQFRDESLLIGFKEKLPMKVDSANLLLYRPSDSDLDINLKLDVSLLSWAIPGQDLSSGRYILKLFWYSDGLEYEVNKNILIDQ